MQVSKCTPTLVSLSTKCGASAWNSGTVSGLRRERFWVEVDLKRPYRNGLNEWMKCVSFFRLWSEYIIQSLGRYQVLMSSFHSLRFSPINQSKFIKRSFKVLTQGRSRPRPSRKEQSWEDGGIESLLFFCGAIKVVAEPSPARDEFKPEGDIIKVFISFNLFGLAISSGQVLPGSA